MALFTDGSISEVQDLLAYEANLVEVGTAEQIDLESKLRLAQTELGAELSAASLAPGNIYWSAKGWNSTGAEAALSRFTLDQVVITSPLKLWHTFQTLAIVYRDAYNRKLNDKYLPKWTEYKELARWAQNLLFQTGIGLVGTPVPRAAQPTLDWVSGTLAAMTLYVRMGWIGTDGKSEGAPSLEVAVDTPANTAVRVMPPPAPSSAVSWNVYVGSASGTWIQQNSTPLALGTAWVMPATGLVGTGAAAGSGQEADLYRTVPRFVQRG